MLKCKKIEQLKLRKNLLFGMLWTCFQGQESDPSTA